MRQLSRDFYQAGCRGDLDKRSIEIKKQRLVALQWRRRVPALACDYAVGHCSFGCHRRARREDAIRFLQSVEKGVTPRMDIMRVELRHHRLVADAALLDRHRQ